MAVVIYCDDSEIVYFFNATNEIFAELCTVFPSYY